jgi:hypothetical protein
MGNRKQSQAPLSFGLRVGARQWWRIDVLSRHDKLDGLMRRSALPRIFLGLIVIFMMGHPTQSLSEEQPRLNLFKQYAPALLTRTVYMAPAAAPYHVEMWDLLVGPSRKTDAVSLPGSAVLEVRSGAGLVTIDGKPHALRMGSTFAINEGSQFAIDNGQQPRALSIRAIVISSRPE